MSIYDINKKTLTGVYDIDKRKVKSAYNIKGDSVWSESDTDLPDVQSTLKVMTYNLGEFSGRNTDAVINHIINTYNPNIIGLQEVYKTELPNSFNNIFVDYPNKSIGIQVNKTVLVSKLKMTDISKGIFLSQTIEQRGYNKAYIEFNGKRICLVNTHLETTSGGTAKANQAKEVYDIVKNEEYFIVTGDFNTICKSINDPEYTSIMLQFINDGCNSANCSEQFGFNNTWTSDNSLLSSDSYPCDHIITSKNIEILEVVYDMYKTTINSSYSIDHIPVIATLKI